MNREHTITGPVEETLLKQLAIAKSNHSAALNSLEFALGMLSEAKNEVAINQRDVETWSKDIEQTSKLLSTIERGNFNRSETIAGKDGAS